MGRQGSNCPPPSLSKIFLFANNSFGYRVEEGQIKIGVKMGERGVCILRADSKQSSGSL